eukprot:CAMPEP_0172156048 /NCGR_PEP_ID=MMETSP1050-20130122/2971_1 /TAXON_ID=233186 /ORGANISM="Cryptomonas curvata, Strain CCAP979/52" /LENGTH=41 /DNA_ID= /DNA_START= /DNA_END= /DNA_ORIENTATION=
MAESISGVPRGATTPSSLLTCACNPPAQPWRAGTAGAEPGS